MLNNQTIPSKNSQNTNSILIDGFERVKEIVHSVVNGLDEATLAYRPNNTDNSIAWLVWHLTRIQDDHIADLRGQGQIWITDKWQSKFNLPFDAVATGYGHSSDEVAAVKASPDLLIGYYDAVHAETVKFIAQLQPEDYDRIVDTSWNPPVTLAVRLVSVLSDDLQHAGQAAYIKGLR